MALSIKHPDADQLARALAGVTGLSITDAIIKALREQLEREMGRARGLGWREELRAISTRCAALPDLDLRTADEIVGFDDHGIPA